MKIIGFRVWIAWSLVLIISIFCGCGGLPKASVSQIEQFRPVVTPGPNETLIYLFRQSTMVGAAMTVSAGYNEKLLAKLSSGSYCYFLTPADLVTVHILQANMPVAYCRVDNRPNETVYLYYEYTKGKLYEVPKENAIAMISKFKKKDHIAEYKKNPAYETALINPGFVDLYLMKESSVSKEASQEEALITFIRDRSFVKEIPFGIWSKDHFLGNLKGETYFQIAVPAGKHLFFGKSEHWSVLEADVEAGKRYFVHVTVNMGWTQAHIRLLPVNEDTEESELKQWLEKSERITIDQSLMDDKVTQRLNSSLPIIEEAAELVSQGKIEKRMLKKSHN